MPTSNDETINNPKRTINGKSLKQVQDELLDRFAEIHTDATGKHPALKIDQVEDRLRQVLGWNYDFTLVVHPYIQYFKPIQPQGNNNPESVDTESTVATSTQPQGNNNPGSEDTAPTVATSDVAYYLGTGRIVIRDDYGNVVCVREQGGGSRIIVVRETGLPKDPTNDYQACIADILKKCARSGLGVGSYLSKKEPVILTAVSKFKQSKKGIFFDVEDSTGRKGTCVMWLNTINTWPEEHKVVLRALSPGEQLKVHCSEKTHNNVLQFVVNRIQL